jgi:hypothetical protein
LGKEDAAHAFKLNGSKISFGFVVAIGSRKLSFDDRLTLPSKPGIYKNK